jgi:outer membrane protein, multidrug efflux system
LQISNIFFFTVFFLFFITSCAVGPDYKQPKICLTKKYNFQDNLSTKQIDLKNWWQKFNDPVLDDLINQAIENNYDLAIALERIEETRSLYKIERAKLFPEISASARTIRARISQNIFASNFLGPTVQNIYVSGFDASWEIDVFGGLRRAKEAAFYDFQSQIEHMRDVLITLLSDVARNYMQYINTKKLIFCSEKIVENQKKIIKILRRKKTIGLISLIELENEIAILTNLENELTDLKKHLNEIFNRLAILLGTQPERFQLCINPEYEFPEIDKMVTVGIPSDLLRRRPDIRKSERELAKATANIGVAVADLFPKFSLTGNFVYLANEASSWFKWASRTWTIGPTFDWNIFAFGKFRAKVQAKKYQQKQVLLNYEKTIISALEDVENALIAFFYEKSLLGENLKRLTAIKTTFKLNGNLLKSGLSDQQKYLQSENLFLDTKKTYINSQKDLINNLISLYKSLGGGWEYL